MVRIYLDLDHVHFVKRGKYLRAKPPFAPVAFLDNTKINRTLRPLYVKHVPWDSTRQQTTQSAKTVIAASFKTWLV
jgi:hypothetical protein